MYIYFPAALSSTATLLWLLKCYLNELTKANKLNIGVFEIIDYFIGLKKAYKIAKNQINKGITIKSFPIVKSLSTSSFLQFKLLPSDRQLVHHEFNLHRCASDQRLLEIPASCHRISDDNLAQFNIINFL